MVYQIKCQAKIGCEETTQMFRENIGQLFVPSITQQQLGTNAFILFRCKECDGLNRAEVAKEYLEGLIESMGEWTEIPEVEATDLGLNQIDLDDPNVELEVVEAFANIDPDDFYPIS